MLRPSKETIRSPVRSPPLLGGLAGHLGDQRAVARGGLGGGDAEERAVDLAVPLIAGTTSLTVSIGTAKPTPVLASPPLVAICELTPITRPCAVEQRAAGVAGVDRRVGLDHAGDREAVGRLDLAVERGDDAAGDGALEAERAADRDRRARPGAGRLESASSSGLTPPSTLLSSTSSTAMSVDGSVPTTFASTGSPFSEKRTETSVAPSTTWSLVTIVPSVPTTKPEPEPWPCSERAPM